MNSKPNQPDEGIPVEREPTPREQAALEWVVRCQRGLTGKEELELDAWLKALSLHRDLFREFGGTWSVMARLQGTAELEAEGGRGALETFAAGGAAGTATSRRWFGTWPFAAAAAAVIAVGTFWSMHEPPQVPLMTDVGAIREVKLPDGTWVKLNTDSGITMLFSPAERRVRLGKGEAYFDVAKDAARPFVVEAAGMEVRAVGTAFNVRIRPAAIDVLVTEGKVRVAEDTARRKSGPAANAAAERGELAHASLPPPPVHRRQAVEVMAGQRLLVPIAAPLLSPALAVAMPATTTVATDEAQRLLAWRGGWLGFSDTPLGEMVEEFNRYNRHKLRIAGPELAAVRVGGLFRADDRTGFIRLLEENFGVRVELGDDCTILYAVLPEEVR